MCSCQRKTNALRAAKRREEDAVRWLSESEVGSRDTAFFFHEMPKDRFYSHTQVVDMLVHYQLALHGGTNCCERHIEARA